MSTSRKIFKTLIFAAVSWAVLIGCSKKNENVAQNKKPSSVLPEALCENTTYKFGTVTRGDDVRHSFTIKNIGSAQLTLLGIRTSCPCVVPHLSGTDIAPGQEGKLTVRLNTARQKGELSQTVTLKTNDPNHDKISFKIQGNVLVLAAFEPDVVSFGDILKSSTKSTEIRIVGTKTSELRPGKLVSSNPDHITAELVRGGDQVVRITLKAPAKEGRLTGILRLSTGLDKPKEIRARVMARVSSDLVTDRTYALFSEKQPGDDKPGANVQPVYQVHVRSLTNKPFHITGVRDPLGVVTGQAKPARAGWTVEMKLSKAPVEKRGVVLIDTDRKDQPTLSVKYIIRSARASAGSLQPRLKTRSGMKKPLMRVNPKDIPGSRKTRPVKLRGDLNHRTAKIKRLDTKAKKYPPPVETNLKTKGTSK